MNLALCTVYTEEWVMMARIRYKSFNKKGNFCQEVLPRQSALGFCCGICLMDNAASSTELLSKFVNYRAQTYLQPHYGNGVFVNVNLSACQH